MCHECKATSMVNSSLTWEKVYAKLLLRSSYIGQASGELFELFFFTMNLVRYWLEVPSSQLQLSCLGCFTGKMSQTKVILAWENTWLLLLHQPLLKLQLIFNCSIPKHYGDIVHDTKHSSEDGEAFAHSVLKVFKSTEYRKREEFCQVGY